MRVSISFFKVAEARRLSTSKDETDVSDVPGGSTLKLVDYLLD